MKKIVIIGATSGIGRSLAELYAKTDSKIAILGRREEKLHEIASSCEEKYITQVCDITNIETLSETLSDTLNKIAQQLGSIDLVIIASGTGEENPKLEYKLDEPTLTTNVLGWSCVAYWAMGRFEAQGHGHLVSISSVGGLRGSGISPAYNATKAFQINFMEGMRQKTAKSNNKIFTTDIRPGFIDTAMAKGEGIFWMTPLPKAALQIYNAIESKKKVAYISKRWRFVAYILRQIPPFIYNKM